MEKEILRVSSFMTKWNVEEIGYKPITTFWSDFCIADAFGETCIKDTFKNAFNSWKDNYKYLTELALVLNHKSWYWYEKDEKLSQLYIDLYNQLDEWARDNLKGNEASYYYRTLD